MAVVIDESAAQVVRERAIQKTIVHGVDLPASYLDRPRMATPSSVASTSVRRPDTPCQSPRAWAAPAARTIAPSTPELSPKAGAAT